MSKAPEKKSVNLYWCFISLMTYIVFSLTVVWGFLLEAYIYTWAISINLVFHLKERIRAWKFVVAFPLRLWLNTFFLSIFSREREKSGWYCLPRLWCFTCWRQTTERARAYPIHNSSHKNDNAREKYTLTVRCIYMYIILVCGAARDHYQCII